MIVNTYKEFVKEYYSFENSLMHVGNLFAEKSISQANHKLHHHVMGKALVHVLL